jgi:hypothetical protein
MATWGKVVNKGCPILTAEKSSQSDACEYKFSGGAGNRRGSVEYNSAVNL